MHRMRNLEVCQSIQHFSEHKIFHGFSNLTTYITILFKKKNYHVVEVFILKLLPVDALTSSAILVGEVASLDHETFDDCKNKSNTKI